MSESPEIAELKQSGSLVGLAAMECLLRQDHAALNELLQNVDDVELGFAVAFLAGTFAAFVAYAHPDPQGWITNARRELLGYAGG